MLSSGNPSVFGRDLRHDGVGAGADVGGGARHLRVPVGAEDDAHGDRHLQCFPHARRHPPADQIAAVTHRAWLGVALAPPERVGALAVAFAQGLAAERPVFMLVAVRVTPQTQFNGIELERHGELVHGGFERIQRRAPHSARACRTRSADPGERAGARRSRLGSCRAGRTSPSPAGKVFVLRGHGDRIVRDRLQRSAGRGAEPDTLNYRGPITQCVHLRPSRRHADGALQRSRRQHGQHPLELRAQPRAEPAAHERRHDTYILGLQAEHAAQILCTFCTPWVLSYTVNLPSFSTMTVAA